MTYTRQETDAISIQALLKHCSNLNITFTARYPESVVIGMLSRYRKIETEARAAKRRLLEMPDNVYWGYMDHNGILEDLQCDMMIEVVEYLETIVSESQPYNTHGSVPYTLVKYREEDNGTTTIQTVGVDIVYDNHPQEVYR